LSMPHIAEVSSSCLSKISEGLADWLVRDLCSRLLDSLFEDRDHVLSRLDDIQFELEAFADEFLRTHMVDEREKGRPVAVDVADDDRLGVPVELRPGRDLDQFFKRAEPARQRHETI